jgi:hypothetical protein
MIKSQNHQVIRPIGKPLTEAEKKQRVIQFVQQKREAFALTIMGGFCSNPELFRQEVDPKTFAGFAVKTADALFEELYPLPEEKEK